MPETSRVDIVDATLTAFAHPPVGVLDLLEAALAAHASPGTLEAIKSLPDRRFTNVRELWPHLDGVPVESAR